MKSKELSIIAAVEDLDVKPVISVVEMSLTFVFELRSLTLPACRRG